MTDEGLGGLAGLGMMGIAALVVIFIICCFVPMILLQYCKRNQFGDCFNMGEIFGGIMKCDTIAGAIIEAAKEVGFEVPLVVRLEGTNVDAARAMLEEAKSEIPSMQTATDLADAARTVCEAVG